MSKFWKSIKVHSKRKMCRFLIYELCSRSMSVKLNWKFNGLRRQKPTWVSTIVRHFKQIIGQHTQQQQRQFNSWIKRNIRRQQQYFKVRFLCTANTFIICEFSAIIQLSWLLFSFFCTIYEIINFMNNHRIALSTFSFFINGRMNNLMVEVFFAI